MELDSVKTELRLQGLSQEDIRLMNPVIPISQQHKLAQQEYTDDQVTYEFIKQHSDETMSVKRNSNETYPVI